jgi:hypothetical protein
MNDELSKFVRDSLARGLSRENLQQALSQAGWGSLQINIALNTFADIDFPIPVPKPKPYVSARDAFLYLVLFSTLYSCAFNSGSLIFELIDYFFPDPIGHNATNYSLRAVRWATSSLIVSLPIFLYTSQFLRKKVASNPIKSASKVQKWLTYITLFFASSALICDLTLLVFNLLSGGLAIGFLLKSLTVGLIAGAVFFYYLPELRQVEAIAND